LARVAIITTESNDIAKVFFCFTKNSSCSSPDHLKNIGVSAAKRDQIVKKFFLEIMNILNQMIEFESISLMKKFLIKFSIWSIIAAHPICTEKFHVP